MTKNPNKKSISNTILIGQILAPTLARNAGDPCAIKNMQYQMSQHNKKTKIKHLSRTTALFPNGPYPFKNQNKIQEILKVILLNLKDKLNSSINVYHEYEYKTIVLKEYQRILKEKNGQKLSIKKISDLIQNNGLDCWLNKEIMELIE